MKWFLLNFILSVAGYFIVMATTSLDLDKASVFLGVFSSIFFSVWLMFFFINRKYFFKLPILLRFTGYIIKELFLSNLRIAKDVLTPGRFMRPAIIAIPLDVTTDNEIVALATLITFTPGTLSLKVSDDKKTLYIHEMYVRADDIEATRRKMKHGFERRILELSR